MSEILLYYRRPDPTTWVYLSSFLTIGLYFVFHRFWSIRNLDLVLLILLAPGLLIVHEGYRRELAQSEALALAQSHPTESAASALSDQATKTVLSALPIFALFQDSPAVDSQQSPDSPADDSTTAPAASETIDPAAPTNPGNGNPGNGNPDTGTPDTGNPDDGSVTSAVDSPTQNLATDSASTAAATIADAANPASADAAPVKLGPRDVQRWGFVYLFIVEAFLLLRLMLDPLMVRRPLLDPNLTSGGLTFIGISLFIFMMANVVTSDSRIQVTQGPALGPGYAMMNMLPAIPTRPVSEAPGGVSPPTPAELSASQTRLATIAKALAIAAHLAIVTGIVLIGNRHFGNIRAGVGCATLYLMLPYTAQMTGRVDHALPAALLLWAVLTYRRPLIAGVFLGLAGGLVYYPLFLLPLWFSFYWQRGARQFAIGVIAMLALLMLALSFDDTASLTEHLRRMFGLLNPNRDALGLEGFWSLGWEPIWRLPVIVAFVILCVFFAIWPAQKNLGTLISGSAAVMVASQFWHGYGGGLYIAWFLPLLLLAVFRPNLQDRIATKMVTSSSRPFGRKSKSSISGFAAGT
ncbi:hypothetical protein K227x_61030 [Rubripirellula lacrimiformis]|uniref:Transmembrane protein n=1 Tax=Rubripirellula lacrimiformis TaxID=1930273 RepID=A0A517NKK9_9BACT|nr:hypothetical protein [Rubripirellula lacrimiformis]QDT07675.1 hypothetical protein K227x_61030 [Rubripirellula lacrimiformis]